jgi:hypothetical protein
MSAIDSAFPARSGRAHAPGCWTGHRAPMFELRTPKISCGGQVQAFPGWTDLGEFLTDEMRLYISYIADPSGHFKVPPQVLMVKGAGTRRSPPLGGRIRSSSRGCERLFGANSGLTRRGETRRSHRRVTPSDPEPPLRPVLHSYKKLLRERVKRVPPGKPEHKSHLSPTASWGNVALKQRW